MLRIDKDNLTPFQIVIGVIIGLPLVCFLGIVLLVILAAFEGPSDAQIESVQTVPVSTPAPKPATKIPSNNTPITPAPNNTFKGYTCTSDCSGHEAGYDWASENDVCDTEYDSGNSNSFNEGVVSYAEENC